MARTTRGDLEMVLQGVARQVSPGVDLELHAFEGGSRGNLYRVRQDLPDGGVRDIGPAGYAGEFELFLRGLDYGLRLADGVYDEQ